VSTRSEAGLARAGGRPPVRARAGASLARAGGGRPPVRALAAVAALVLAIAGCGSSGSGPGTGQSGSGQSGSGQPGSGQDVSVTIDLTPQGCAPRPAKIRAGHVQFNVANRSASAVSEAELRTADLAHILGEQENLTPGLSGGFALDIQPGRYQISCPGAAQPHSALTVTGIAPGPSWTSDPQLSAASRGYYGYVRTNTAGLVSHTQALCQAIDSGHRARAQQLYPTARVYYERIEPVAEVWGDLDTQIDGRWENPVTVAAQFIGFHKIEQLMWEDRTLAGASGLCAGLVRHEQRLRQLVSNAQYSPLEMASGATDLINEAATAKITGEEERYSHTDLVDFQANVDGAMKVAALLRPYLDSRDPGQVPLIQRRNAAVTSLLADCQARPGYVSTGFVSYATVTTSQRRQLSAAVNALAEAMSQTSGHLG
jgi:iron uptake system component EfeO